MKESYWEKIAREKLHFLYPNEHIAADISKGVVIGVGVVVIGLVGAAILFMWWDSVQEQSESASSIVDSQLDKRAVDVSTTTYKYQDIVFQVVGHFDASTMKIFQDDKLVFTKDSGGFSAVDSNCPEDVSIAICDTDSSPAFGVDINGDGNKNFVFEDMSGGSGGYAGYIIFELPKNGVIKELMSFPDISGGATFKDLNADGKLEVKLRDSTFAFWHASHAQSPYPTVYLSWDKAMQTYTPDLDLMRKLPPPQIEINKQVNFYKNTDWCTTIETSYGIGNSCSMPWSYALDLIYSGNATSAKKYLEAVWPFISERLINDDYYEFPTTATEQYLKNELLLQLKQSPYYKYIFTLNGGKIF